MREARGVCTSEAQYRAPNSKAEALPRAESPGGRGRGLRQGERTERMELTTPGWPVNGEGGTIPPE